MVANRTVDVDMSAMSSKTVLEKGGGLHTPNELSTAVLNVVGKLVASDGTETVFEQQQGVKHTLGRRPYNLSAVFLKWCMVLLPLLDYLIR